MAFQGNDWGAERPKKKPMIAQKALTESRFRSTMPLAAEESDNAANEVLESRVGATDLCALGHAGGMSWRAQRDSAGIRDCMREDVTYTTPARRVGPASESLWCVLVSIRVLSRTALALPNE